MSFRFLFIVFFILSQTSFCQNSIDFSQLSGENSSTQSITYAIKKDSIGNLWIASEEGVLKHNSKYYKLYNTYNGLPKTLSNRTSEIFIDSKGNIFAGLEKGVCIYNPDLDKFDLLTTEENINPSLVNSIKEDENGTIWIGGFNGLWKYDEAKRKLVPTSFDKPIMSITVIRNIVFCGTEKGLFSYNLNTEKYREIELDESIKDVHFTGFVNNQLLVGTESGYEFSLKKEKGVFVFDKIEKEFGFPIKDIIKGDSNSLFIATDGDGIYQTKNNKILKHYLQDFNNPTSLSSNGIYDIEIDKSGILWIATYGGGINYFNFNKLPLIKIQHELNNTNSLSSNFTRSIAKDKYGKLWFGTKNGLSIWNQKNNTWKHIKKFDKDNLSQTIVLALEPDNKFMWVGTYSFGLYKINIENYKIINYNNLHKEKNLITKIYTIKKDKHKNIWVAGIDNEMMVIKPDKSITKFPLLFIKSITELENGQILASGRYGVHKINPSDNSFRIMEELEPNEKSLAFSTIQSVKETSNNNLVIGTNGAGVIFYNSKTKEIKKINIGSGLPSDIVQGVLLQNDNNIWASTTQGLANIKITDKDTIINVYDKKDGLASTEFNYGSYAKLDDNFLAFGGVDGISLFNPNKIKNPTENPNLVLDNFKLFNKTVNPSDAPLKKHINVTELINLKYNENSIGLEFVGIDHSTPNNMKYSWILEGFDKKWSKPSNNNLANYTNLEAGNYIFKVKAINKYDISSDIRTIKIEVLSPWWLTNTAYFIYFLLSILLIWSVIHFTSILINKKNADDQIEFFNNITHELKTPLTILMSSLEKITNKNDSKESNKQIQSTVKRLNSLFEQMLNFHKVTSQDNIYQNVSKIKVENYLKARVNNFEPLTKERDLTIKIENNWPDNIFYYYKDVFDKIFLNLLSNAIKYSFKGGNIIIKLNRTTNNELKLQICDDGLGIPKDQQKYILKRYYRARNAINSQSPGTGLGLIMTKKLIEKTGGTITFNSIENKGTTFTIILKNLTSTYEESIAKQNEALKIEQSAEEQLELGKFSDAKILIVEDNDELRANLVENLGKYFLVFEASNGKEGIEIASQNFPDLIITDLIMPEMDGVEMAKRLKEDISLNHIPVFMLTVLQNSNQKIESIESGVSEYLEKPVNTKLLLAKITNTLKFQRKLREKYIHENDSENANLFRNKKDSDFVKDLEDKIIENIENNSFSVHDLSGSFGMSRTSLYMKLKNLVNLSPQDFIIHTKLKHAKNLLIKGELSIKEVAYSSGFSNPKYFSTSFKKFYGQTPSGFLDSLKKE
ncbi:hybrid sensor histidine kinase/response regulator transcription factor [Polaribacter septentrionalilitoris]|uniref:hybrid sensor histidine kinase/response regulator transcription factor n=1 Tax=Polaribacter septentrionalilitoris TaxID=2494657 RepID=UPI00135C9F89|nr:two-component regulator propeller domain-containing protein [Polaribacter septentrionalilitoris]